MYSLRYSTKTDLPAIKILMQNVFGDSDDFIHLLFDTLYKDNVLLYSFEEKVVSMAFLLPASLQMQEAIYPVTYLYACATAAEYRGQGLMRKIIEKAFFDTCEKKELALFLLPASESLYQYYSALGFDNFFYQNEILYSENIYLNERRDVRYPLSIEAIPAEQYQQLRLTFLPPNFSVQYPVAHFQLLEKSIEEPSFYKILHGGQTKGICYIEKKGALLRVKEMLSDVLTPEEFSHHLFHYFNVQHVSITTPGTRCKSAMIKACRHHELFSQHTGYFNFALD